jgi:ribA/ribD-fused uncharacterized protein
VVEKSLGKPEANLDKTHVRQMESITAFQGEYRWLSNFWPFQVPIEDEDLRYFTVENAYQAFKTFDRRKRALIATMQPGAAKRAGQRVDMRSAWESIKVEVMRKLVLEKFSRNPELKAQLLATGDAYLEEGNYWGDRFWGTCQGSGENWLGKALMLVRHQLAGPSVVGGNAGLENTRASSKDSTSAPSEHTVHGGREAESRVETPVASKAGDAQTQIARSLHSGAEQLESDALTFRETNLHQFHQMLDTARCLRTAANWLEGVSAT